MLNVLLLCLLSSTTIYSQTQSYNCEIRNEVFVASTIFEFDLYLTRSGTTPLGLAGFNTDNLLNSGIVNVGKITRILLAGFESNANQVLSNIEYNAAYRCVKIAPKKPARKYVTGVTSGTTFNNISGLWFAAYGLPIQPISEPIHLITLGA
jgi:hypothetical protein